MTAQARLTDGTQGLGRQSQGLFGRIEMPGERVITVALTVLMVGTVILSLDQADWISPRPSLALTATLGLVLGFRAALATRWTLSYHVASIGLSLLFLLIATMRLVPSTSWEGQMVVTLHRLSLWYTTIADGGASTDQLPLALGLAGGVWLTSYVTALLVLRYQTVWALVPSGVLLFTNLTYLPERFLPFLSFYLFLAALLLSHLYLQKRVAEWRARGVEVGSGVRVSFLHYALWFSVLAFIVSLIIPSIGAGPAQVQSAWNQLRSPVGGMENQFTRILAAVPGKKEYPLHIFGPTLPFRGNISLSERPVYLVDSPIQSYWRGRTYDVYQHWGWENADRVEIRTTTPRGDILPLPSTPAQSLVVVAVVPQTTTQTLIYTGEPLRVSIRAEALTQPAVAGNAPPEVLSLRSPQLIGTEDSYVFEALIPIAEERELRRVDEEFPRWLEERYLQLPATVPTRVGELARSVVADADTLYDKVRAVEDYLRQLPYSQKIDAPPVGADGVDYFLFTVKSGYSDYYASAMTVMLRSVGIPARMVTGFLSGDYDPAISGFVVREEDAHAWTEVYFPPYGWIQFEPTHGVELHSLGTPPIIEQARLDTETELPSTEDLFLDVEDETLNDDTPLEDLTNPGLVAQLPVEFILVASLIVLVITTVTYFAMTFVKGKLAAMTPGQCYRTLVRLATLVGVGPQVGETPQEYQRRLQREFSGQAAAIEEIVRRYAVELYGRRSSVEQSPTLPWGRLGQAFLGRVVHLPGRGPRPLAPLEPAYEA